MSIGGENRVGHLSSKHLLKMTEQCELNKIGITADGCVKLMTYYAEIIPEKLADVFDSLNKTNAAKSAKDLRAHLEEPIVRLCAKTKERL